MNDAREFAALLASLLRHEHGAMADFLLALADFDAKRSWEELGHTSLFYFLHRELKLSAGCCRSPRMIEAAPISRTLPDAEWRCTGAMATA